jgi:hypothetical protein
VIRQRSLPSSCAAGSAGSLSMSEMRAHLHEFDVALRLLDRCKGMEGAELGPGERHHGRRRVKL